MDEGSSSICAEVLQTEAAAVSAAASGIDEQFERAVRLILDCPGAGADVRDRQAGSSRGSCRPSFSRRGRRANFLNPAEGVHGDVGSIRSGDVVVMLSDSG